MAFASLQSAPWGVLIRESEAEALAPAQRLKERAIWLGIGAFAVALLFAWATVRSITRPVAVLTAAAQRIASGDLSGRVPVLGGDEIGHLATTFEIMRIKLNDSLETIQAWSRELEARVRERTREMEVSRDSLRAIAEENATLYEELKRKEAARSHLLKKVIGAQEDERRRIARELHDETSQSLTALAVGLETAGLTSESGQAKLQEKLASLKELAVETLERVHDLIYDLRPSVLDDLGLVAGLRWYAESRLQTAGVRVRLQVKGSERRLPAEAETALFRIGQEAVNNVARHARASSVLLAVTFEDSRITLDVNDDGEGFNVVAASETTARQSGWGLMGMEERATLLGGTIEIASKPGSGTRVRAIIPVDGESGDNAKDPRSHS
jgi:signal transduction histidine kinase